MKYTLDKKDRYAVFNLHEENLNSMVAPKLKSEFIFIRNEGVENLILDMSDVEYVDSSGLSAILTANRLWKDNGAFVITGVDNPSVRNIFNISRLDSILNLIPTMEESVEYVMMDEMERKLKDEEE